MKRFIATLLLFALAAMIAGCEQKEPPPSNNKKVPSGSDMFDKKELPNKATKGPAPG